MDNESEIEEVETDFHQVRDEMKAILFDIRTYIMERQSPIPNDLEKEKLREELDTERR
jgi:hypothetical protein